MADWISRLNKILEGKEKKEKSSLESSTSDADTRYHIIGFIENAVIPAFTQLKKELENKGRKVVIEEPEDLEDRSSITASISVYKDDEEEFYYAIQGKPYQKMNFAFPYQPEDKPSYCKAVILLRSGVQGKIDIKKYSKEDIIQNFLDEYSKWVIF
ncbi:hypothetical protein [Methanohalobium sp.]|uniref:hypothetical protein n=1 Tax=Methanohalobium sp. TaxID=2837493 RepID=UPI0025F19B3E|nr:hypothetical protein [Methanohalobium sp.]